MLKPYMGFSNFSGSEDGAVLIFAHTAKEARVVGWIAGGDILTDDYSDFTANLLRNHEHLFACADQAKIKQDIPHMVMEPPFCAECGMWGDVIGADGLCDGCRENYEELNCHG